VSLARTLVAVLLTQILAALGESLPRQLADPQALMAATNSGFWNL